MHPPIAIFCAFTRRWALETWIANLKAVAHDPALTDLCCIVDCDEPYILKHLERFAVEQKYHSFHVKMNPDNRPNEIRLAIRRQRVADVHEQAKDLIAKTSAEIIIGLEDDTVFDRLPNFDRLIKPLELDQVGFVQGVQMGRWGANMIGAWLADDIQNPRQIETLLPPPTVSANAYQNITGGGWYGYATRRRLFLEAPYYTSPSQPWGPDVNFGFYVRQQGFECLMDWQTVFGHNDHGQVMYPDDPKARLAKIMYNKSELNGKWDRTDHEQTRY